MKVMLNFPVVKAVILGLLSLIISFQNYFQDLLQFVGFHNTHIFVWSFLTINILTIIGYTVEEVNSNTELKKCRENLKKLKKENKTFIELMSGNIETYKSTAAEVNNNILSFMENGTVDLKIWSFDKACNHICNHTYGVLCEIGEGEDFEVVYVRLREDELGQKLIYVNAFCNKDRRAPSVFLKERNIKEDSYYDSSLFRNGKSDNVILVGSDEISEIFTFSSVEAIKKKDKYTQYIAIPVFCESKMIGLFEVACLNRTKLADDKEEIKTIISRYIMPNSFFLLMLYKLEKALMANDLKKREK